MRSSPSRKLSVSDLMILVVAVAVACWLCQVHAFKFLQAALKGELSPSLSTWQQAKNVLRLTQPVAMPLIFALVILRLRRPRPSIRRLTRQPGFVACLGSSLAVLTCGPLNLSANLPYYEPDYQVVGSAHSALVSPGAEPGIAVAACWLMLALGRRWQTERTWIDRAGRLVGVYWLVMIPVVVLWDY